MAEVDFQTISQVLKSGQTAVFCLVTSVDGHSPRKPSAKMLVLADGSIRGTIGGGRVEAEVISHAKEMMNAQKTLPETVRYKLAAELGMCCGGAMEIYFEPCPSPPRLWIFGAGHVGSATAPIAKQAGFHVIVVDDREDWNSSDLDEDPIERRVLPYEDVLSDQELQEGDYAIIVTRNHDADQEILFRLVSLPLAYLGMIGSTRKVSRAFARLRADGISEEEIAKIHAPVGIDLGAETPEEIAVSIVAELIACRRGRLSVAKKLLSAKQPATKASAKSVPAKTG